MTKGIFVIVAIYGALFIQYVFKHKFLQLFRLKWILLVLLTGVFILPELYALYSQFDLHPEKVVFGRHNVSGIKWFFWDSQFGRFVNNGPITRQSGDVFFYLHTLLWAFAPWCLVFYYAIFKSVKNIAQRKPLPEYYSLGGGLLLLLLFSLSRFQLPFYTNTVFPLFAIVTAPYCYNQLSKTGNYFRTIGLGIYLIILPLAVLALHYLSAPGGTLLLTIEAVALVFIVAVIIKKAEKQLRLFLLVCAVVLFADLYINTVFYKLVISYRGQIKAARYVNQNIPSATPIYNLSAENNVFQFYTARPVGYVATEDFKSFSPPQGAIMFANQKAIDSLRKAQLNFKEIKAFSDYHSETATMDFINKATRNAALDSVYLISK